MTQRQHVQSLQQRAIQAVLLTIGFYTLALVVVIALLSSILIQIASGHIIVKFALLALVGAVAIIIGVFPRPDRFNPPWPRLKEDAQPRLFRMIRGVAAEARQDMPAEVYLLPDTNAWVATRGGFMGVGGRRVMGIGLPLLYFMSTAELTAVVAHEFGHYHGGDTRLGPWIHKTRMAIGRTLATLHAGEMSLISRPFGAYARMFMRITQDISRQQEYTADAFAVSIAGPGALKTALERLGGQARVYDMFWNAMVEPTLRSGYLPPITQGLREAFASDIAANSAARALEAQMQAAQDEYDSHPPLRERIAALDATPGGEPVAAEPALALVDGDQELWHSVLSSMAPKGVFEKLEAIDWIAVGEKVFLDPWRLLRDRNRECMGDYTVAQLPQWLRRPGIETVVVDHYGRHGEGDYRFSLVLMVAVSGVALALADAGWTFSADPASGTMFRRGEEAASPDQFVEGVATGSLNEEQWLALCRLAGILGAPLVGSSRPPA